MCGEGEEFVVLEALYGINLVAADLAPIGCQQTKLCSDIPVSQTKYDVTSEIQDYCDNGNRGKRCKFVVPSFLPDPCVSAIKQFKMRAICKATPAPTTSNPTPELDASAPTPDPTTAPPAHGTVDPVPFWSCKNQIFSDPKQLVTGLQCDEGYGVVVQKLTLDFKNIKGEEVCPKKQHQTVDNFKEQNSTCAATQVQLFESDDAQKWMVECHDITTNKKRQSCYDHTVSPFKNGVSAVFQNVFFQKNDELVRDYQNFLGVCYDGKMTYKIAAGQTEQSSPVFHGTYKCVHV